MSHEHGLPYDVQQNLIRVFQSICITSPTSFDFPATPPSEPSTPIDVETEERQRLVRALTDTLYSRCFARSLLAQTSPEELLSADDFRRRLSIANQGRDEWIPGWRVREVKPGGVLILAQGERLRVAKAGDYAMTLAEDIPLCVGCGVTLRVRKESLALQEGTYCALGEESPTPEEESEVLRIYFNATQAAAIKLVELTTQYFNEWRVPFTLKIMLNPQDRDRSDAAVLYLPKIYYPNFVRLLSRFPLLRDEVPLFTKRLLGGIGLAESPAGAESFGMHRCRLLAEGIVDAWLDGRQDVTARLDATERKFLSEGFSLARPYLNPGDEDIYVDDVPQQQNVRRIVTQEIVLTAGNVVADLKARGLCDNDHEWQVSEYRSRNRNFGVVRADGAHGFFVKQLRVQDPESFRMMQREAMVYQLAQHDPDFEALKKLAPVFFTFDDESQIVVIEFVGTEIQPSQLELAQNLGAALATLHRRVGRGMNARETFPMRAPAIFDAHRNGRLMRWLGPGQKLLIAKVLECDPCAQQLDELVASWRYDTFIHGDIKFENCILRSPSRVMLVDWELADYGEAAWDIGSVFQSYLSLSLLTAPAIVGLDEHLKRSRVPIQRFWQSYCEASVLNHASRQALLNRSLKCAAARMIQTALEVMQGQPQPTSLALILFEASVELLTRLRHIAQFLSLDEV